MKTEVYDRYIIERDKEYLVAVAYPQKLLTRWSISPWDAAMIEDKSEANRLARRVKGRVRQFNPVTGVLV